MWNINRLLLNLWPNKLSFLDLFDLLHKVSLVEQYLNTRPTFTLGRNYFSPEVFNIATLRRSQLIESDLLSEVKFPSNRTILEAIQILSQQSRQTLSCLIADLHEKLLNFKNLDQNKLPHIGSYVYIPDRLIKKKRSSLVGALGRVTQVVGRTITIKLTSGIKVKRHCTDIILFQANPSLESMVDVLNLPLYGQAQSDSLILSQSQFKELETGGYFISTGDRGQVFHRKPVQDAGDVADRVDPDEEDFTDLREANEDIQPSPPNHQGALRRSTRPSIPSMKFLEQIAHVED